MLSALNRLLEIVLGLDRWYPDYANARMCRRINGKWQYRDMTDEERENWLADWTIR